MSELPKNTGLARRLGAMIYDLLLVIALMMIGTLPFIAVRGGDYVAAGTAAYQWLLVLIAYLFFVGFWTYRGRTLGMQSWGLQLECMDGGRPGLAQASIRFVAAVVSWVPAGLGYWWQLWDKEKLTWHDRISGTRIRHYPRQ